MTVSVLASPSKAPRFSVCGIRGRSGDDVGESTPIHMYSYTYMLLPSLAFFMCVYDYIIVGASLREPHTSELNSGFFIYRYIICRMYSICLFRL